MASAEPMSASSDAELLVLYRRKRDQQAFAELVGRYHSMVFGVASRMLGCNHAAEDVMQATFLVLAKDARKVRKAKSLASWLYGVAFRLSARMIRQRAREKASELREEVVVSDNPLERLSQQCEHNVVLEELHSLPERFRLPMVLRYLVGQSNADIGSSLKLTESAVEGRLKRGRNQLRLRLARRGVAYALALALLDSIRKDTFAASPDMIASTVDACFQPTDGYHAAHLEVTELAQKEILAMTTNNILRQSLFACATLGVLAGGWSLAANSEVLAQAAGNLASEIRLEDPGNPESLQSTVQLSQSTTGMPAITLLGTDFPSPDAKDDVANRLQALGYRSTDRPSEKVVQVMEQLQATTQLEFSGTPLQVVTDVLEELHDIDIVFDDKALEDNNIDPTADLITADVRGVRLENGLSLLLEPLELTAIIYKEVLYITSVDRAEEMLETRVYKLDASAPTDSDSVVEMIEGTVRPHIWESVGGPGSIAVVPSGLVIMAPHAVHDQVNKLLVGLETLVP